MTSIMKHSIQAAQAKILSKKQEYVGSLGDIVGHILQLKSLQRAVKIANHSPNVRSFYGIVRTFVFCLEWIKTYKFKLVWGRKG